MPERKAVEAFRSARDLLFRHRDNYDRAYKEFSWPELDCFNWAIDWFDTIRSDRTALWVVEESGFEQKLSFAELSDRSSQVANHLSELGVSRGDRVIVMLGNRVELWETLLAAMKLGAVVIPATTLLRSSEIKDRVERGNARHVIVDAVDTPKFESVPGEYSRIAVGETVSGWCSYEDASDAPHTFEPRGRTHASDPLLLYFTSGTTAAPKLVEHTHASYPVGHLSTMYWLGLKPADVHLNVSSPGWAKHAWSNVFAPWNAEATVLIVNYARFDAALLLERMVACKATTFCAPPTVWRMLIQEDLSAWKVSLREATGAGEPLNPEVIEQVRNASGVTIRDGYGQTETTAQIGNPPGPVVKPGSMGRPLPGYEIALLDTVTGEAGEEGEICLPLDRRSLGLMSRYRDSEKLDAESMRDGHYHTGDVGRRDADGYITYVGRADDVFKASDYRISPFELESILLEHPAVAEAAVIPAPDPIRLAVPKAYIALASGHMATAETAREILRYTRERLAPYKRVRRVEFSELPKTISGKIRRVELRMQEQDGARPDEYREEEFPDLKQRPIRLGAC